MRTPFVAGNWKMNTDRGSARALAQAVADAAGGGAAGGVEVGIAPPFVYLAEIAPIVAGRVLLGAQDCYCEPCGAFTGEISPDMLRDVGCDFAIIGHSERRHLIGEGTELLAKKAAAVYNAGLILVHCVGETLAERDADRTLAVIEQQLAELSPKMNDPGRLVIAYEPVWAIGTGRNATEQQAQEVHAYIRSELAEEWNHDFADAVRIIYGGSCKPENATALMGAADVDGALVGGASLKAETFLPIVRAAGARAPKAVAGRR